MNNKILVVDDESRIRKIIRDFLVREGYVVCEAEDGEAALDIFCSNNDIDLIIMDVMMPKMDGWQLCKEVRKLSKVPILMLTAKSEEQDELKGFELGVDEYISKPFSPKILTARVFPDIFLPNPSIFSVMEASISCILALTRSISISI